MSWTEVLPYDADRAVWLAERSKGIGGSDVAAILGLSRWSTPRDVWLDKTGRSKPKVATWPMRRGVALELPLLEWFSEQTGRPFTRIGHIARDDEPWMRVSLDALSGDSVLECKTTTWRLASEWSGDQVADAAELQVQWGMAVTGLPAAFVIAAVGDDDPVIREVTRDDALIADMTDRCGKFWRDYVLADREPPLTHMDRDSVAVAHPKVQRSTAVGDPTDLQTVFDRRAAATARIKIDQHTKDECDATIIAAIADAEQLVVAGEVWATRSEQTRTALDMDALAADAAELGIDLDDYRTTKTTRVLRVVAHDKRKALSSNG